MNMNGISVIIPTLNRTDFLVNTIKWLIVQKCEVPFEVLIIDQSAYSDIKIEQSIHGFENFKYHHIDFFRGLPEARNYGAQKAKYDILVYIDDDIECNDDFLQKHYETYLFDNKIVLVAGGITEKYNKNIDCDTGKFDKKRAISFRGFHRKGNFEVEHAGGGNFSVVKDVFFQVNGIDENLTKGAALHEETDFCLRVKNNGGKIWFNYDAHVYHLAAATGGCRVTDIEKYIYNLIRNRSIVIQRHLNGINKLTSTLELFRLVSAYAFSYKKPTLFKHFIKARLEGKYIGKQPSKMTKYE